MKNQFLGWSAVAIQLRSAADSQQRLADEKGDAVAHLNFGQRASLRAIAARIPANGIVIADEVGMGKTRIAVELIRAVVECGGRVAVLIPPGLSYQWRDELRDGQIYVPEVLRGLEGFLSAWEAGREEGSRPWANESVVVISHVFTNWRLGNRTRDSWRWALLPEILAKWRQASGDGGRVPRGYHNNEDLNDPRVTLAAKAIVNSLTKAGRLRLDSISKNGEVNQWGANSPLFEPGNYGKDTPFRNALRDVVGIGLGEFDLIIVDEGHKARGQTSGLSGLIETVLLPSSNARRVAMTATPVELDSGQWKSTLGRIGVPAALSPGFDECEIGQAINYYADAVHRLRRCWQTSSDARDAYALAAQKFKHALAPYLVRRDKREDSAVQEFQRRSGLSIHAYRREQEVSIEAVDLPLPWRQTICAAEAYSITSFSAVDSVGKRLRLTMGSGYGLADLMDRMIHKCEDDDKQIEASNAEPDIAASEAVHKVAEADSVIQLSKRQQRADWWLQALRSGFSSDESRLFDHPSILAAVNAIENETSRGEKVLVFGRFTRPMRALVQLLNAREMLRCLELKQPWPQAKVHGVTSGNEIESEWPSLRAAHRQLKSSIKLNQIDALLRTQYQEERIRKEYRRSRLMEYLEIGLAASDTSQRILALFAEFKCAIEKGDPTGEDRHPLAIISRAISELIVDKYHEPESLAAVYADAFCRLIDAASDRDNAEADDKAEKENAQANWKALLERLHKEYNRPQGAFARLMFGETEPHSRRMIQLAFNRPNSFPRVLVAQSMVGREGLNLHLACRIVVLLHPEWNPGVVEQQIGRVDRVGSHWSRALNACSEDTALDELPRIEVRPVIFRGTYDEHNWTVLRERWDDMRSQLHGVVVPDRLAVNADAEMAKIIASIQHDAPNFSPQHKS